MKRQADSQCIEKDKRNKTGTDEENPGHVPIYDPIRAQMNTSNNGRNTPVYTQQMYPHSSMLQGALGASYPHYREEHFNQAGVSAVGHRAQQTGTAQRENLNATAYNRQAMMQPTSSHQPWAQFTEQHFNPAFNPVFAVGNRAYHSGRAQVENSDVTAHNRQTMMQVPTHHLAGTQFRLGSGDQLQRSYNDLRCTPMSPMHVGHYVNDGSLVHQQMHPHPSILQGAVGASNPYYNAIAYNQQLMMQRTLLYHFGTQFREEHFNSAGVSAVGHRAYQTGRAEAENSDATAYNQQMLSQPSTLHHAETQFRSGSSNQLQRSTNDLRYTSMHSEHYANDSSPVHQQTPAQPSTSQLGQTASNQNSGEQHAGPLRDPTIEKGLDQTDKEKAEEQQPGPSRVCTVEKRTHQTDEGETDTASSLDLSNVSAQTSHIDDNNRQMCLKPSLLGEEMLTSHQPHQMKSCDQLPHVTDLRGAQVTNMYCMKDSSVVHQQISQSPMSQTKLEENKKEKGKKKKERRNTKKEKKKGIQRLRKILKDYIERECQGSVTENYDDLKEPTKEVFPKLLWLLRFYEGDLLKMMSQYQKDPAFMDKRKATSSGKELDYKTFLRHIMETETKRISVIAQAGSGKTVMLKRLARDLVKHNDELLIFFMNFRDFTDSKEITPCDFLINGRLSDSDAKHSCYEWILENQDKVMLVLDGLDQATWDIDEKAASVGDYSTGKVSEIVSSIFKGKLFPDIKVVYSSREHAVASLVGELRPKMLFALTGLSPGDSEWLFKSFVGENEEILWEKLRTQFHSLIPLLSIPAFNIFTAIVYVNKPEKPPRSMTEVLKSLLEIFMLSGHIMEKDVPMVLAGLKKMSFVGMKDGKVLFYIENVRKAGLDLEQIYDWIITIPGPNRCNQFLLEGQYVLMFSHPIIQKFLAALYIIEMDLKSFEFATMQYLGDDKWSVVARFVSGLLFNDEAFCFMDTDVKSKRNTLKNMLVAKGKKSFLSSLKLLSVTAESNCEVFIRDIVHDIRLRSRMLNDSDAYTLASVMRHLVRLNELSLQSCNLRPEILQILWKSIENINLKISKLDLSCNNFDATQFSMIGNYAKKCSVTELRLNDCNVTHIGLGYLLSACKETKISKLDISKNTFNDEGYETLGKIVKTCAVDELRLEECDLGDGNLKKLLLTTEQANISKLDISKNKLEKVGYATLGQIVKRRAVDELWLKDCNLSDEKLKSLLLESGELRSTSSTFPTIVIWKM